jgi:hypothetical protein
LLSESEIRLHLKLAEAALHRNQPDGALGS